MRIRIGNYVAGINANKTEHAVFGRFMFGKVADTMGVLNSIRGSTDQMFFADFDHANYAPILLEPHLSDILLFKSKLEGRPDHYFIISPFHYDPKEIRLLLANWCGLIDPKFVGVYMRDGVNAIRLIPKQIRKKQSRQIEFVRIIKMKSMHSNPVAVRGMLSVLNDPNGCNFQIPFNNWKLDDSIDKDITIREYETIRW